MTAEWAANCLDAGHGQAVAQLVTDMLAGIGQEAPTAPATEVGPQVEVEVAPPAPEHEPEPPPAPTPTPPPTERAESATEPLLPFELSPTAPQR
jgi:hypothetical protein